MANTVYFGPRFAQFVISIKKPVLMLSQKASEKEISPATKNQNNKGFSEKFSLQKWLFLNINCKHFFHSNFC